VKNTVKIFVLLWFLGTSGKSAEIGFFIRLNETGYRPHAIKTRHSLSASSLTRGVSPAERKDWRRRLHRQDRSGNNLAVALATQGALYERMTGDARYRSFTTKQFDWLLGRNPWGVSMFTGIPANGTYPRDVHLFATALLKREVRGGLVDGPVYRKVFQSLRGVFIREPDPFAPFQDERAVYHDDINDYATNEPTMDGTAAAILMWGAAKN
jgi:hypothetical protein